MTKYSSLREIEQARKPQDKIHKILDAMMWLGSIYAVFSVLFCSYYMVVNMPLWLHPGINAYPEVGCNQTLIKEEYDAIANKTCLGNKPPPISCHACPKDEETRGDYTMYTKKISICADNNGADRYVLAHELYHAYQYTCGNLSYQPDIKPLKWDFNDNYVIEGLAAVYGAVRANYTEYDFDMPEEYEWIIDSISIEKQNSLIEQTFNEEGFIDKDWIDNRTNECP
jgi:hypothetical protein